MFIKEIRIKNFRSIVKADIKLNDISIFVGLNDVGKSNILKALNLFFNDETDYDKKLNFDSDFCKYSPHRNKKADEIVIEIIFNAPANYKGSKDISWTKVWRKYGFHNAGEKIIFVDGTPFPERSKLYSWLHNIRYSYVPAIRDTSYFQILLAKLHDSLAETIELELRKAGDDFIDKIKSNTDSMIKEIDKRLKINSEIKLPSNLQSLFKTLDFSTTDGAFQVSLSNRGDGIKTRHIPVILKFISEQLNINRTKGSANINMIWGYEEPENNLEMLAAFNLAKEFIDYSKDIQLLITTHSPGFYSLKDSFSSKINLFKILKHNGKDAEIKILENYNDLDDDMGVMPLIAPYVKEKVEEINKLQLNINSYKEELDKFKKHVIFVEGDDEVRIYEKIIKDLGKEHLVLVSQNGFGCSGVKNQIMAWSWVSGVTQFKAFGVFDNDISGKEQYNKLLLEHQYNNAVSSNKVKAQYYRVPSHLINIKKLINTFPVELEEMYSAEVWSIAEEKGWLQERPINELHSFVRLDSINQSILEKINSLGLTKEELLYIKYKVPDNHKDKLSKFLITDTTLRPEKKYGAIMNLIQEIIIPFFEKI